jgi:hypothetical protein
VSEIVGQKGDQRGLNGRERNGSDQYASRLALSSRHTRQKRKSGKYDRGEHLAVDLVGVVVCGSGRMSAFLVDALGLFVDITVGLPKKKSVECRIDVWGVGGVGRVCRLSRG